MEASIGFIATPRVYTPKWGDERYTTFLFTADDRLRKSCINLVPSRTSRALTDIMYTIFHFASGVTFLDWEALTCLERAPQDVEVLRTT